MRPLIQRLKLRTRAVAAGLLVAVLVSLFVVVFHPLRGWPFLSGTAHQAPAPPPLTSFVIGSNGRLLDANGHDFVMRGVSHMHTTYPDQTAGALAAMKRLGANTVRIELSTGAIFARNQAADVANVISL